MAVHGRDKEADSYKEEISKTVGLCPRHPDKDLGVPPQIPAGDNPPYPIRRNERFCGGYKKLRLSLFFILEKAFFIVPFAEP